MRYVINKKEIMTPKPHCFACKSEIIINRNSSNDNVLYFDKRYYHKDCLVKMKEIKKKCFCCKKDILIQSDDNELIYYDKHYMHTDCFVNWCNEKKTPKRKNALLNIEKYMLEANKEIKTLFESKNISENKIRQFNQQAMDEIKKWFDGSDLCSFIKQVYDIKVVPWQRIKKVINGDDKSDGIPADDLLDMWDRKLEWLNSVAEKKKMTSPMTQEQRVLYDLAILKNKYNSYLQWKEKQKILEIEQAIEREKGQNIITNSMAFVTQKQNDIGESDDISDLVDDIFG